MSNRDANLDEMIARIDSVERRTEIELLLREIIEKYGLKNLAYLGVNLRDVTDQTPCLAVTYSDAWVAHYKQRQFASIDPAIKEGLRSILPIDWQNVRDASPKIRNFFGEAREFDVGRNGLTIPIRGLHSDRALVTFTSDEPDREWQVTRRHFAHDFQELSTRLHMMILRSERIEREDIALSKQQIICLKWATHGYKTQQIADLMGLSENTVKLYLRLARTKLGVTNTTQAVGKAVKYGLLTVIE